MRPVFREIKTDLPPQVIWDRLAVMDWEAWDPDVAKVSNVKGGLIAGGRFLYELNNGLKMPSWIEVAEEPRRIEWKGAAFLGLMGFWGEICLRPDGDGSHVTYAFKMTRLLGWYVDWRYREMVVNGVDEGLRGIITAAR